MREIKYRARDKNINKMVYIGDHWAETLGIMFQNFEDADLMQYTGLKDSTKWEDLTEDERSHWTLDGNLPSEWNGKKNYEKDIVRYKSFDGEYYIAICPSLECFHFYQELKDCEEFEILGNEFENPELLIGG